MNSILVLYYFFSFTDRTGISSTVRPQTTSSTSNRTGPSTTARCVDREFKCDSGECIPQSYVCDGYQDCR